MTRRRITLDVRERIVVIRGWKGGDLAREGGCRPIFSGSVNGWIVDRGRLPDLLAYLDHRGIAVQVTEAGDAA